MPNMTHQVQGTDVRYPYIPILIDTRTGAYILNDAALVLIGSLQVTGYIVQIYPYHNNGQ